MALGSARILFTETRLSLEPAAGAWVVNISLPTLGCDHGRAGQRWSHDDAASEDEKLFQRRNLASASSVFFRPGAYAPRAFLWRVLHDGHVLSLRSVDLCKAERSQDAPLILNLRFPVQLQPLCVELAADPDHDAIHVFALDLSHHLYSITLRPDHFRRRSTIEASMKEACKVYLPPAFSFKHPYRLFAPTPDVLIVSLVDGGLVRLDRNKAGDSTGLPWKETFYHVQGWAQGLRNLLPFQGNNAVRHGKLNLDLSAIASGRISCLGLPGEFFFLTVCLDHKLRVWNLANGQVLHTRDILDIERTPQDLGKYIIDPSHTNLVQAIEDESVGGAIVVTYSPIGAGEFKFWTITALSGSVIEVQDAAKGVSLVPSPPSSSDVWILADFTLVRPLHGVLTLWTLWRNNISYRVRRLQLDLADMSSHWKTDWDGVHVDASLPTAPASGPYDPIDCTEKWLQTILAPGRFTRATIETALSIYERGLGGPKDGSRGKRSLADSICSVLASTASLDRNASGSMDYEQFRATSEIQWRRLYRLILELDKYRGDALSLVVDQESDLGWVVCADAISTIRECSMLEQVYLGLSAFQDSGAGVGVVGSSALISAGLLFVDGIPDGILHACHSALQTELFEDSPKLDLERVQSFADKAGLWRGVTEEDCVQVVETVGAKFRLATAEAYDDLLQLVARGAAPRAGAGDFAAEAAASSSHKMSRPLTNFGRKLVVKAVQETTELQGKFLLAQLILLVHMELESDSDDDALHNTVDVGAVFGSLVTALRRLELIRWLVKTEISMPIPGMGAPSPGAGGTPTSGRAGSEERYETTALESNLGHLLGFGDVGQQRIAATVTAMAVDLCAADSEVEVSATLIQCYLLRSDRADLAAGLSPFCGRDTFAVYVQGRIWLALRDHISAATCFRKASVGMSSEKVAADRHSSGLLDDTEWALLNKGLGRYYYHILSLFEKARAHSYVVDFARLALQFTSVQGTSHGHGHGHGPDPSTSLRTEILSRLFQASTATWRFELALSSVHMMPDVALQTSSLRRLVDRMCDSGQVADMLALPFGRLYGAVDDLLDQRARASPALGSPYPQILYAWRMRHGDMRGAAAAALLMTAARGSTRAGADGSDADDGLGGDDGLDTAATRRLLVLANGLSCLEPDEAWLLSDGGAKADAKRTVITLADARKQYHGELDRLSAIQNNLFALDAGDAMEGIT